jgi:alkanesulfonate monooxygenase SsuD/methylene tetrahydromethanopterin reductase-like flavin-dependent oxidoreductase (luciferase family)
MSFVVGLGLPGVGVAHASAAPGRSGGAIPLAGLLGLAAELDGSAVALLVLAGAGGAPEAGGPDTGAGDLDPWEVLAHLVPRTRRVGLVARTPAVLVEPFHLAVRSATLDHLSGGRAGWFPEPTPAPADVAVLGEPGSEESRECLAAVRLLWDSWEDDARVRDVEGGRYLDGSRLHHVDFVGRHLRVRGPSVTPRPPQGRPVVFGPGPEADVLVTAGVAPPPAGAVVLAELAVTDRTDAEIRLARAAGCAGVLLQVGAGTGWADRVRRALAAAAAHGTAPGPGTLRDTLGLARPANAFAGAR